MKKWLGWKCGVCDWKDRSSYSERWAGQSCPTHQCKGIIEDEFEPLPVVETVLSHLRGVSEHVGFEVVCDETNNDQANIQQGVVNVTLKFKF